MHWKNIEIVTPRLLLREYRDSDWQSIHLYAANLENIRHMNWGPNSVAETQEALRCLMQFKEADPRTQFELAIISKDTSMLIGGCGIRIQDRENRSGDFGYVLNMQYWKQGLGLEAAQALLKFGFEQLGLHRIWATCSPENIASQKLLEKCGLKNEGLLRENILQRGEWRNSLLFAILVDEWRQIHV